MSAQQRRIRDLVAIAIFVVLLLILFWPSGEDESETDAAPDGVAEFEVPAPEATTVPANQQELACEPDDAARLLNSWVRAFNTGDVDALAEMLPEDGAESPVRTSHPGMNQSMLHSFTVHESGSMTSPGDVVDYLSARHDEQNERWRIDDVELQRLGRSARSDSTELDRATVRFRRTADDLPPHEIHGDIVINCYSGEVLLVDLISDDPELALPIPVEEFLGAVGPYGTGEMRDLRMLVSTDLREDGGSFSNWDIRRIEANSMSGNYVETVRVQTLRGNQVLEYTYDGMRWYLDHRGWQEVGDLTGRGVLPLEIMMTRLEPSITANILRDNIDEIPNEGTAVFTGEFEVQDELRQAAARIPLSEAVDGVIEVEVEDGNLVRTNYRLVDRQLGMHSSAPEIQWLHIRRLDRYEPPLFSRPSGFNRDEQQFHPPAELEGQMELIERFDHSEGIGERFTLMWNDETIGITAMPSRSRSREFSWGDDWPLTWDLQRIEFGDATIITGGPDQEIYPAAAVWDTGRYRFELEIDPETLNAPDQWELAVVREIANVLLAAETSEEGQWFWLGSP